VETGVSSFQLRLYQFWYILKERAGMSISPTPEIPVRFYRSSRGNEPVLEWLRALDRDDRRTIGLDLMRVQLGWPIGMPLVRNLRDGLWEVRSALPSQRVARLILCVHDGCLVVLHAFIKKTQKTPAGDLEIARRRMKEVTA
jgi:phage-related protein